MWARTGEKGLIREVGFELCFEENVLVQIGGGNKSLWSVRQPGKNTKRETNLTYFEDRKVFKQTRGII